MPFTIYWDNSKQEIIRIDVIDDWTWEEYDKVNIQLSDMIRDLPQRVDFIVDMRKSGAIPYSPYSTQHVKRGRDIRPKNYGMTVNIGADAITKITFNAGVSFSSLANRPKPYADSLEEAYKIIEDDRKRSDQSGTPLAS